MTRLSGDLIVALLALGVLALNVVGIVSDPTTLAARGLVVLWCGIAALAHFRLHIVHG